MFVQNYSYSKQSLVPLGIKSVFLLYDFCNRNHYIFRYTRTLHLCTYSHFQKTIWALLYQGFAIGE